MFSINDQEERTPECIQTTSRGTTGNAAVQPIPRNDNGAFGVTVRNDNPYLLSSWEKTQVTEENPKSSDQRRVKSHLPVHDQTVEGRQQDDNECFPLLRKPLTNEAKETRTPFNCDSSDCKPTVEVRQQDDNESTPLLEPQNKGTKRNQTYNGDTVLRRSQQPIRVYAIRWYVLAVFASSAVTQASTWNCFGPIAQSSEMVFDWTDGTIGMFANLGNIAYCIFMLPAAYLMDVKGLRIAMIACSSLMAVGTGLRCITSDPVPATWLVYVGQILNGIGGTIPFAAPPLVSAIWFPPNQRATATAISSVFSYLGTGLAFIIGPLLVPPPPVINVTSTSVATTTQGYIPMMNISESLDISVQRDAIMRLMYYECGFACCLFLVICIYFPDKPPTPPSISASLKRNDYMAGLRTLIKHGPFWLVAMAYSVPTGVYGVWGAVLDVNLSSINISQKEAGWLGFYATISGCISGVVVSRFADVFMRHLRLFLLLLFVLASAAVAWFTCLCLSYIPFNTISLYASCILAGLFINGSIPLFYELACEVTYPVSEGTTGGFMTVINNFIGIGFLSALEIPGIGKKWMNWCLLGSTLFAIPLLLMFRETYARTDIDTLQLIVPSPDEREETSQNTETIEHI